jgi:hypothetical protein
VHSPPVIFISEREIENWRKKKYTVYTTGKLGQDLRHDSPSFLSSKESLLSFADDS